MEQLRKGPARQQGAGYYALIVVLTLLGVIIYSGLKVAPAYVNDQIISTTLDNLRDSGDLAKMPLRDIRQHITRTMQANGESFDSDSIDQVEEGNVDYIVVKYESRRPLFYNMEVLVKFNHRVPKQ